MSKLNINIADSIPPFLPLPPLDIGYGIKSWCEGEKVVYFFADTGNPYDALFQAIIKHEFEEAIKLFKKHKLDINYPGLCSCTPLMELVSRCDDEAIINFFLDQGASFTNKKAATEEMALHLAARAGKAKTVQILLERGAEIEARTKEGQTPLMIAAENGQDEVARVLCEQKADVDATDDRGNTALHIAAQSSSKVIIQLLLNKGADSEARNNAGKTASEIMEERGFSFTKLVMAKSVTGLGRS